MITKTQRLYFVPSLIVAVMLLLALVEWPYGYYQLLRFPICGVGVYIILPNDSVAEDEEMSQRDYIEQLEKELLQL